MKNIKLTPAQDAVLNQLIWLDDHFNPSGDVAFWQYIDQFKETLGLCRRSIQSSIAKLKELGFIYVFRRRGFKANFFMVDRDAVDLFFSDLGDLPEKVRNAFKKAIEASKKGIKPVKPQQAEKPASSAKTLATTSEPKKKTITKQGARLSPSERFRQKLIAKGKKVTF